MVIVDADEGMLRLAHNLVSKMGYGDVFATEDANKAWERIKKDGCDLLILEWKGKPPAGSALYYRIRGDQSLTDLPIVLTSGFITKADLNEVAKDKRCTFISKPFTRDILGRAIITYLRIPVPKQGENAPGGSNMPSEDTANTHRSATNDIIKGGHGIYIHKGDAKDRVKPTNEIVRGNNHGPSNDFDESKRILGSDVSHQSSAEPQVQGADITQERQQTQEWEAHQQVVAKIPDGFTHKQPKSNLGQNDFSIATEGPKSTPYLAPEQSAPSAAKAPEDLTITKEEGRNSDFRQEGKKPDNHGDAHISKSAETNDPKYDGQKPSVSYGGELATEKNLAGSDIDADATPVKNQVIGTQGTPSPARQPRQPTAQGLEVQKKPISVSFGSDDPQKDSKSEDHDNVDVDQELANLPIRPSDQAFTFGDPPTKLPPLEQVPDTVMIVDSDLAICGLIRNYMSNLGSTEFFQCETTEDAWNILKKSDCNLIFMDWRQKDFPGLRLYNRIRSNRKFSRVPVVVLSGNPMKEDFRLLEECGWTSVISKPLQMTTFKNVVEKTISKSVDATNIMNEVLDRIEAASSANRDYAEVLKDFVDSGKDVVRYVTAAGQYYFAIGNFQDAEKIFKGVLKVSPDNVTAMTELAKILHRMNRPAESFRLLQKASAASPHNIERLCMLGEVGLDLKNVTLAKEYFANALKIDKEHQVAQAGLKVADNLADFVKSSGAQSLSDQFSSNLNIVGITLVRNNEIERGIEQYRAAMCFVRDKNVRARLYFNLGMAYLRKQSLGEAKKCFRTATRLADSGFKKPAEYLKRIRLIELGVIKLIESKAHSGQKSSEDLDDVMIERVSA